MTTLRYKDTRTAYQLARQQEYEDLMAFFGFAHPKDSAAADRMAAHQVVTEILEGNEPDPRGFWGGELDPRVDPSTVADALHHGGPAPTPGDGKGREAPGARVPPDESKT